MDGAGFKQALGELGYTQASFSRAYRIPIRTVENWVRNGPPEFLAQILQGMRRLAIEPPSPDVILQERAGTPEAARALDASLRFVLERAVRAGWPRDLIVAGAITWFAEQVPPKR